MPFKSQAQRERMYANYPDMAKKWEKHTPDKKLPSKLSMDDKVEKKLNDKPASDNAAYDSHHLDPAKLSAEVKKDLGIEAIQSASDKYMKESKK